MKALLEADARLAAHRVSEARLYEAGIFHWLYAGDTALHLAVAGHRVGVVRLLLAAGADPNTTTNSRRSGPLHYAADGYVTGPARNPKRQVETIRCLLDARPEWRNPPALRRKNSMRKRRQAPPSGRGRSEGQEHFRIYAISPRRPKHCRGGVGEKIAQDAQRQIIALFLAAGLRPKLKDGNGKSVLDCAKSEWIREMLIAVPPNGALQRHGKQRRYAEREL